MGENPTFFLRPRHKVDNKKKGSVMVEIAYWCPTDLWPRDTT